MRYLNVIKFKVEEYSHHSLYRRSPAPGGQPMPAGYGGPPPNQPSRPMGPAAPGQPGQPHGPGPTGSRPQGPSMSPSRPQGPPPAGAPPYAQPPRMPSGPPPPRAPPPRPTRAPSVTSQSSQDGNAVGLPPQTATSQPQNPQNPQNPHNPDDTMTNLKKTFAGIFGDM